MNTNKEAMGTMFFYDTWMGLQHLWVAAEDQLSDGREPAITWAQKLKKVLAATTKQQLVKTQQTEKT
jgi:hypothetical protein